MDAPHGPWQGLLRKSLKAIAQECYEQYWTSPEGNVQQNSRCMATNQPSRKLSKLDQPDLQDTPGEVKTNSLAMYSSGPLNMDEQSLDDKLEPIYRSSVPIEDVAWKTCQERWMIETSGERGSGRYVLPSWHDDE